MTAVLGENLGAPSANKVLRQLKRQEQGLFNCVASVIADAAFVQELAAMYPQLPVVPNLRCGAWYVPRHDASCYFKSMDGHAGRWAFSLTRLNWQLAELAAASGGAFVVDATRRGKTFPDALTKTIPIWAAVLNCAVAHMRERQARQVQQLQVQPLQPLQQADCEPPAAVQTPQLELSVQVSEPNAEAAVSSAAAGKARFTNGNAAEGAATAVAAAADSPETQQVTPDGDSASASGSGSSNADSSTRCDSSSDGSGCGGGSIATLGKGPLLDSGAAAAAGGAGGADVWDGRLHLPLWISAGERAQIEALLPDFVQQLLDVGADVGGLAAALRKPLRPLWLSPASRVWVNHVPHLADLPFTPLFLVSASSPERRRLTLGAGADGAAVASFEYVPGAGDDEEGWARGLTPQLLWAHRATLLAAGPAGIADAVSGLLSAQAGGAPPGSRPSWPIAHPAAAAATKHRPPPLGCAAPSAAGTAPLPPAEGPLGVRRLGRTGLALGRMREAGRVPPEAWRSADAVLDLGSAPALLDECTPAGDAVSGPHSNDASQDSLLRGSLAGCSAGGAGSVPQQRQYLWLRVRGAKAQRGSLLKALPAALRFVSGHLVARRRVLVVSDEGLDAPACVVVAALLAFFNAPASSVGAVGGSCGGGSERGDWAWREPAARSAGCDELQADGANCSGACGGGEGSHGSLPVHVAAAVSRADLRQALAFVSGQCPEAMPTQGMLKQVFSHFQIASGGNRQKPGPCGSSL